MSVRTTDEVDLIQAHLRTLDVGTHRSNPPKFKELDDIFSYYTSLGEFCIGGEVDLTEDVSKLFYKSSDGIIKVVDILNISEKDIDMLSASCSLSPFGLGGKSVVDPNVRQAKELKAADFSFQFTPQMNSSISSQIKQLLGGREFTMDPYKLNIYPKGGHFKRHKDTLKNDKMIASLVVSLPIAFEGGILTVENEKGLSVNFDWGKEISESETKKIRWACFFCSCDHLISTVTKGNRITIAYDIFRNDTKQNISMSITEIYQRDCNENLHDLIKKLDVTKEYGYFPNHEYNFAATKYDENYVEYGYFPIPENNFDANVNEHYMDNSDIRDKLKGNDLILYDILKDYGWEVNMLVYYPDLKSYGHSSVKISAYVRKGDTVSNCVWGKVEQLKKLSTLNLMNMVDKCIRKELRIYLLVEANKRRYFCGGTIMVLRHKRNSDNADVSSSEEVLESEILNNATGEEELIQTPARVPEGGTQLSKFPMFQAVDDIFSYYTSLGKFCIGGEAEFTENASKLFYKSSDGSMQIIDFLNVSKKDVDVFVNNCPEPPRSYFMSKVGLARKLQATEFSFQFCSKMNSSITSQIKQLLRGREFIMKPYRLFISVEAGHFVRHYPYYGSRNEKKVAASLVICLPIAFEGGITTVKNQEGLSIDLDWGKEISEATIDTKRMRWACFCYGCDNFISKVTKGNKITIVYDIFSDDYEKNIRNNNTNLVTEMYLADCCKHLHDFIRELDVTVEFGYYPNHVYSLGDTNGADEDVGDKLKGNDLILCGILKQYGWKVILLVYSPDIAMCGPLSSVKISDCVDEDEIYGDYSNISISGTENCKSLSALKLINKEDKHKRQTIKKYATTGNEPVYDWISIYGNTIMVLRHQSNSRKCNKYTKKY